MPCKIGPRSTNNFPFQPKQTQQTMADLDQEVRQWQEYDSSPRRTIGTWLGSTVVHAGLLIVLAITIGSQAAVGVVEEPVRTTGIVLKTITPQGKRFEGSEDNIAQAAESANRAASDALIEAIPNEQQSPVDPSEFLPDPNAGIGPPAGNPDAGGGNPDIGGKGFSNRNLKGGQARTEVFGVTGEGSEFVYVFDSSSSMTGRPLAAAKQELLGSLESLGRVHQFQIIFYNESPTIFTPDGVRGKLVFATEENKRAAKKYVADITAQVATRHEPALMLAVGMKPDVIFFLTDGDEPQLSSAQLKRIRRANRQPAAIHVIQFGVGAPPVGDSWLKKMARENQGQYSFFNILQLSPR